MKTMPRHIVLPALLLFAGHAAAAPLIYVSSEKDNALTLVDGPR